LSRSTGEKKLFDRPGTLLLRLLKYLLTILVAFSIALQPFSKLFSLWNLQQDHYYASETATVRGKAIVYCGDEKALTKKMVKDQAKKLPAKQTQQNNTAFQAIAEEVPTLTLQAWPAVTTLYYPNLPNKPVKGFVAIFQPPKV